jgi:1,4-alpha-glucan branching enzyme
VEQVLEEHGLSYFFVDRHLLSGGRPLGVYADRFEALRHVVRGDGSAAPPAEHPPYRAYRVGKSESVACFGRDPHTAIQVWSGEHGYPGAPPYLDFHKKRFPGGHRYWSVTHPKADLAHKTVYRPEEAEAMIAEQSAHFLRLVEQVARDAGTRQSEPALVCAMYDAELFGHWWFEGPRFLAAVLDGAATGAIEPVTAGEYLERHPAREAVALPEGSWGDGGGHDVWLNDATRWTWGPVHAAEARFELLATRAVTAAAEPLLDRLLAQLGRELLLLESSDWQFLITTFAARDYAELRVSEHAEDFARLSLLAERRLEGGALGESDEQFLRDCETRDSLFPDFDWRGYAVPSATGAVAAR